MNVTLLNCCIFIYYVCYVPVFISPGVKLA